MTSEPMVGSAAEALAVQREAEAEVFMAAEAFGTALRASPEFAALLRAGEALRADADATAVIEVFERRRDELRLELLFGTLNEAQREELERLEAAVSACPSVTAYIAAQKSFQAVCAQAAAVVSGQIGIDFAANIRSGGCCG